MIEIGAQVDLFHPADRVWHALTDRELLGRWFTDAEAVGDTPGRLRFATAELPGFDAPVETEVVEQRAPELITLRCQEADRRSRLTCTVKPTSEGCRLSLRETLEHGEWAPPQRDAREQSYQQALNNRLPALLDWFAFQQVDLSRGDTGTIQLPAVELPAGEGPAGERAGGPSGRRSHWVLLGAAGVGMLLAGGVAVWALRPDSAPPAAAEAPPTQASPSASDAASPSTRPAVAASAAHASRTPSATTSPSRRPPAAPSRTPSSAPQTSASATVPAMAARYETVSSRLLGYSGEVVVSNPGGAPGAQWTLVVTFADDSEVTEVSGAEWRQDGRTVTFTGSPLPAGQSQKIRFDVRDSAPFAKGPESCAIGDNPCEGV
ncbi:SRPBCC domain-containing protein [Micromonospora sp. URMC 103]|uniref:SRPBCC domain-containing protein n=1 Tax=Micromonospora sp. URMC 103 TaxID=3423406 RepID=UPI003F1DCEC5